MRAGLETFAADRRARQDEAITDLTPKVAAALDNYADPDWWKPLLAEARGLFNDILAHDSGGDLRRDIRSWAKLSRAISDTLPKTGKPDEHTALTVATWLSTAAINSAAMSAADHASDPQVMEWVTMHDSKVRHAHADTDGQQRPPGEPFDVDGVPMAYPGDPSAPIDLWINCRCALVAVAASHAASLAASSVTDKHDTSTVIVALPAPGDPVWDLSADGDPHLTLVWLGTAQDNPDLNVDEIVAGIKTMIEPLEPFTADVTAIEPLGEDGAMVWMLDPDSPAVDVHSALTQHPAIGAAWAAVKQYPVFTPHTTIGYDLMLSGDGIDALSSVKQISYDRLALWNGTDRQEFPLSEESGMSQVAAVEQADPPLPGPLKWHGVLAPEGEWSGDGRMFAENSLRFRDLPLPLTWQKATNMGHDGSVVVAKIEVIERVGNMMQAEGTFLGTPEADEAIGLLAEFGQFGVSVDADDAEFDFDPDTEKVTFSSARIASASMVAIPAFSQAFIALGTWADSAPSGAQVPSHTEVPSDNLDVCDPDSPNYDADVCARQQAQGPDDEMSAIPVVFVSDTPWSKFSPGDYTDQQWKSACVLHLANTTNKSDHKLPIKEPGGALNRNGVHAAAGRFNQVQAPPEAKASAARSLRSAYATLGEDPPDAIKAAASVAFGRGPGWITNPEDTKRIHDYWTVPGQPGYAKIGWGTDGDFNRCKVEIGQEIAEKDPATVAKYMNQICAQWHHDATGFWPGHAPAESALTASADTPALNLVASSSVTDKPPKTWFADPKLETLTPITVTEDGQVFGHLCGWETCHVGYPGVCVAPPQSASGYAYFLTGQMLTDDGPVAVGHITLGGGHAPGGLGLRAAVAHYDSTSSVVADVACGDDEHGVWLAGTVRPGVSPEQVVALRASVPSGDWRQVGADPENKELILAHAVNTGGFPVPRVTVHDGVQVSLVAAGAVGQRVLNPLGAFDLEEFADRVAAALAARTQRKAAMALIAARVGGER